MFRFVGNAEGLNRSYSAMATSHRNLSRTLSRNGDRVSRLESKDFMISSHIRSKTSTCSWHEILGTPITRPTRVVPPALDPEDPASPGNTSSADSVLALYFAIPKGRASTTDFASAISAVLVVCPYWTKRIQLHRADAEFLQFWFSWYRVMKDNSFGSGLPEC